MTIRLSIKVAEELLGFIHIPEANCSCHLSPPCGDCMEFGGIREIVRSIEEQIANPLAERIHEDTILLDHLHAKGLGWISRNSTMGRGWRLHQGRRSGNKATVREAIRAEINKAREEYEQECRDAMAQKYSGGYTGPG